MPVGTAPLATAAEARDPAGQLAATLAGLRARLAVLAGCPASTAAPERCLQRLQEFLLDELLPVVRAIDVRIRPALRGDGGRQDRQAAAATAALARLAEAVALLRVEPSARRLAGGRDRQLLALTERLTELAGAQLARDERLLPGQLRRLPAGQAERVVAAARQTARDAAAAPRTDLVASRL